MGAPRILMSELHNVLIGFVRRGTVTSEQAKAMMLLSFLETASPACPDTRRSMSLWNAV